MIARLKKGVGSLFCDARFGASQKRLPTLFSDLQLLRDSASAVKTLLPCPLSYPPHRSFRHGSAGRQC